MQSHGWYGSPVTNTYWFPDNHWLRKGKDMTAISMLYDGSKFVVAADGRCRADDPSMSKERETDQAQKIFPIENRDVIAAYGITGMSGTEDGRFDFDEEYKRQVGALSLGRFHCGQDYIHRLCMNMKRELLKAHHDGRIPEFPNYTQLAEEEQGRFSRLFVCGYFRGSPFWMEEKFYYEQQSGRIRLSAEHHDLVPRILSTGSDIIGNLIYGTVATLDPRISHYRKTMGDGPLEYVTSFIKACSDPIAVEIDPLCAAIGGHIHAAKITREGFRWLIEPKGN